MNHHKHLSSGVVAGLFAAAALLGPALARAQEPQGTPPPLQGAETPRPRATPQAATPEPTPEVTAPAAATPTPTPRVRKPRSTPTPSPDEPVAVVNGSPVYRPLFSSAVADPVDRALVLQEYRRRGYVMPARALDLALANHTKTAFKEPTDLVDKLKELGASYDDYRSFVAEEVKLQAMLSVITKGGRTDADRKTLRETWLAGLRKNARINKPGKA